MLSSFCVIVGCFLVPVSQIIFASALDTFDYGLAGWSAGYCRLDPCWSNPYKTFDSVMNFAHCHVLSSKGKFAALGPPLLLLNTRCAYSSPATVSSPANGSCVPAYCGDSTPEWRGPTSHLHKRCGSRRSLHRMQLGSASALEPASDEVSGGEDESVSFAAAVDGDGESLSHSTFGGLPVVSQLSLLGRDATSLSYVLCAGSTEAGPPDTRSIPLVEPPINTAWTDNRVR